MLMRAATSSFSRNFAKLALAMLMLAAFISAGGTPPTPVADLHPMLQELRRQMAPVSSVYLEFGQERILKLFTEPLRSEGVMLIEKPDQIRWQTTEPYQSILLGNGRSVAQFEQSDGEWTKLKVGFPQLMRRVMDEMVLMQRGQMEALTNDFTLSASVGSLAVITLVPKDKTIHSMLSSLEMHLEPDLSAILEVVMNEPSGDLTRITFRHERRNLKFPPGTFDQTKPADLAVIRAVAGNGP
jgi:outer membrane lipoprotein-sorting protein